MARGIRRPTGTCEVCGKRRYPKRVAEQVARVLNRENQGDWPVHAYPCAGAWHTGHVPADRLPDDLREVV
jgi:hypothetical protein